MGVAIGAAGAYRLAHAYRKARATCPPFARRAQVGPRSLIASFEHYWNNPNELASLWQNPLFDPLFVGKLLLVLAGAQGSRTCSATHLRVARRIGLTRDQAESLLDGELGQSTVREATALHFAREFVARDGSLELDLATPLREYYGEDAARDVVTCVRVLIVLNYVANTLDALTSRLLGQPSRDTTLRDELSVLSVAAFGIVPLLPCLALRVARVAVSSQLPPAQGV